MRGLIMDVPLLISSLIEHAARNHGDTEIVSRTVEGPIHRYTYADAHRRVKQLANALTALGVKSGDRVGTLAWNTYRHYEIYFAVPGMGAVCHTINPRLFPDQLEYIVNHASDRFLFVDLNLLPIAEKFAPAAPKLEGVVVMTDRAHMPKSDVIGNLMCYEDLIDGHSDIYEWPVFDEHNASSLCYTSGTTGPTSSTPSPRRCRTR